MKGSALVAAFGLLLSACATAHVETSWKDPAAGPGDFAFKKVLVMVRVNDGTARRAGEDELVKYLMSGPRGKAGELTAEASYRLLDARDLADREKARALVEAKGFDGLVLMSFVSSEQKVTVEPPSYGTVWGYYGARAIVYDPGYVRTDTILRVETTLYRVSDGTLLWTGISRALNPRGVTDLVRDVAKSVGEELREQGLIP
ncbi:MAG TPA: hypothetical protein VII72_23020 [Myxococcota bacterium]|jgi:hypothetical protein